MGRATWMLCAIAACAAGCDPDLAPELAREQQQIVGGEPSSGDPAVLLIDMGAGGYCTGTLIHPQIVLTAAHCLLGTPRELLLHFAPSATAAGPRLFAIAQTRHSSSDLALLALEEKVHWAKPIPFNARALRKDLVGAPVRLVGYGSTSENETDYGQKRQGMATLAGVAKPTPDVHGDELSTTTGTHGTCYGDSGGPNLMMLDGGEHVVAVTSRGTGACGDGIDIAVRTDAHAGFIYEFMQRFDPTVCASPGDCALACDADQPDCRSSQNQDGGGCQAVGNGGGLFAMLLLLSLLGFARSLLS